MYGLRNKKTGRLLVVQASAVDHYYAYDPNTYWRAEFELCDSEYGGNVWVTTDREVAETLLTDWGYNDSGNPIGIDAYGRFTKEDLEVVTLAVV